jgi:hypothetical protein
VTGITYDRNGNLDLMTRRDQTGAATNMNYDYFANTNRLKYILNFGQPSDNYAYDNNGNMIRDKKKLGTAAGDTVAYDYRNLPTHLSFFGFYSVDFGYDGKGQRISKNNQFYVSGADGRVVAVYDGLGIHLYWNIWGLDLIGQRFWKQ